MRTKHENDVNYCTNAVYVKNETKLLCQMKLGCGLWRKPDKSTTMPSLKLNFWDLFDQVCCDENYTRQWRDRSYKCVLTKNNTKLLWLIESGAIYDKKKIHDNDVTNYTSAVYVENNIELSWPIELGRTNM